MRLNEGLRLSARCSHLGVASYQDKISSEQLRGVFQTLFETTHDVTNYKSCENEFSFYGGEEGAR